MTVADSGSSGKSVFPKWSSWVAALVALAFLSTAAIYASCTAFSYFAFYDDEGLMMISVQGFLDGHPLYDKILIYYGPVYYFYEWFIHSALSVPLTHDFTRVVCIFHWLGAASLLALAGGVITRSFWLGLLVFMQAALHLTPLAREPGHPQELVALLLALSVVIATRGTEKNRILFTLGAVGGLLVFTKINVGVFYGIALLSALVSAGPPSKGHRIWFAGLLALNVLLLLILFRPNLTEAWAQVYCGQACVAVITANAIAWRFAGGERRGAAGILPVGAGFAVLAIVITLILSFTGTSLRAMVENLVIAPSKLGEVFVGRLQVPQASWSGALALLAGLAVAMSQNHVSRLSPVLGLAKGIYGLIGTLWLVGDYNRELGYLWPWTWLVLVRLEPRSSGSHRSGFALVFLALQAAWQGLQGYPIAGTQAVMASFLQILVFSICLWDTAKAAMASEWTVQSLRLTSRARALLSTLVPAGLLYLFASHWCNPVSAWRYYRSVPPLELRGSRLIRLPAEQADVYRAVTHFLEAECDTFITIPGMNSLYFWTGKMPPTYFNVWEVVPLNHDQQTQVIAALHKAKRPLVVLQETEGMYLYTPDSGPLGRLITEGCREIQRFGRFHILEPQTPAAR